MDIGSILAGLGGGGVLAGAINAYANRRKQGADAASAITKAATDLVAAQTEAIVKPLEKKVRELQAEVLQARGEVAEARGEIASLRQTMRETTAELETCLAGSRAKDIRIRDLEGTTR